MFRNGMLSQYKSQLENTLKLTRARINTDDLKVFIETKTESEKYLNLDEGKALPHDIQEICSVCGSDVHVEGAHVVRNQGSIVPVVGGNGEVYIVPLCSVHNNWNKKKQWP